MTQVQSGHFVAGITKGPNCDLKVDPRAEDHYIECIRTAVSELLQREKLDIDQFQAVLPSQFSSEFTARLADALGVKRQRMVDVQPGGKDLFTSAMPYALEHARQSGLRT